ncbi:hypothetical protein ACVWZK_008497 [Bradyrhizobium sp. GM0.4]
MREIEELHRSPLELPDGEQCGCERGRTVRRMMRRLTLERALMTTAAPVMHELEACVDPHAPLIREQSRSLLEPGKMFSF